MPDIQRYDVGLPGCTPEPLMAYLKSLGILRLVSEQKDDNARGWWKNDVFWLRSSLDRGTLATFVLEEYKPTPIVVPWTGSDFFDVKCDGNAGPFARTPTATRIIEAVLASTTDRLAHYREVIQATLAAMDEIGVTKKEDIDPQKGKAAKQRKAAFFSHLRQSLDDTAVGWIDAAGICAENLRFSALLGGGGGSDGNTHFSDNFMQNLWDVLPDFDSQRKAKKNQEPPSVVDSSRPRLHSALFQDGIVQLIDERTSSLYDSGAVGGPNATQGMERKSLTNPWNIILALEGSLAFAGSISKRLGANCPSEAVFPFQVDAIATETDGLADKERAGSEVWLPLWDRPAQVKDVLTVLREGRAQCGERIARSGVDMVRAATTLGVDRGIDVFYRYAIVKGRVGGENYNTAVSLGRFEVRERRETDLLRQIDPWLDCFRRAVGGKNVPPRFGSALRRIDSAIFDFCKYGGAAHFKNILVVLGQAERELVNAERFREEKRIRPLVGLSSQWIVATNDGSREYEAALAIAGIRGIERKLGPLRANLEPVDWNKRLPGWAEKDRAVVWNAADLPTNLADVLARRMMDGDRAGCERLPIASCYDVSVQTLAAFIAGELDDERIEDLIWGLMLVGSCRERCQLNPSCANEPPPLPRSYALLKLLFLPRPLAADRHGGNIRWRLAENGEPGITIRPEPRILPLLRSGRVGEACWIAAQRLRVSGLPPKPGPTLSGRIRDDNWTECTTDYRSAQRLAAALLIPIASKSVDYLVNLVCRAEDSAVAETLAVLSEGDSHE